MKSLLVIVICFSALNGLAQTTESFVEEKSSAWLKVTEDPVPETIKHQAATHVKRKTKTDKQPAREKNTQEEFEKTNSQVNRFKKTKKS